MPFVHYSLFIYLSHQYFEYVCVVSDDETLMSPPATHFSNSRIGNSLLAGWLLLLATPNTCVSRSHRHSHSWLDLTIPLPPHTHFMNVILFILSSGISLCVLFTVFGYIFRLFWGRESWVDFAYAIHRGPVNIPRRYDSRRYATTAKWLIFFSIVADAFYRLRMTVKWSQHTNLYLLPCSTIRSCSDCANGPYRTGELQRFFSLLYFSIEKNWVRNYNYLLNHVIFTWQ